jgi:hypothetical protein
MVFYAVGESFRVAYAHLGRDLNAGLRKASDPNWYIEPDTDPVKSAIRKHCKLVFASLKNAYGQASREQDFRHRNWFRSEMTLKAIRLQLETLWGIVSDGAEQYML